MKLPYKYRGEAMLLLLAVVLPWAAWRFAFKESIGTWRECVRLKARLETTEPTARTAVSIGTFERDLILSGGVLDTLRRSTAEQPIRITGYEPVVTRQQAGLAVHSAQMTLTGGFVPLLQAVRTLETAAPSCRVCSLEWQTETDQRSHGKRLKLTLHIQQIVLKK